MSHHQRNDRDRMQAMQSLQTMSTSSNVLPTTDSDEAIADVDEPPDERMFKAQPKQTATSTLPNSDFCKSKPPRLDRQSSLLTKGLAVANQEQPVTVPITSLTRGMSTASNRSIASAASTADLTSDGHTSPDRTNSPSPPFPATVQPTLRPIIGEVKLDNMSEKEPSSPDVIIASPQSKEEASVEAGLGRRRCIRFACGKTSTPTETKPAPPKEEVVPPPEPKKRACMIRFACPNRVSESPQQAPERQGKQRAPSPAPTGALKLQPPKLPHRDSQTTITPAMVGSDNKQSSPEVTKSPSPPTAKVSPQTDVPGFSEFASSHDEPDQWTNESGCHRSKMTVQDILEKEAKFRRLGEEAEEEALQDEEDLDDEENDDDDDDEDDSEDSGSDDGNESDDEGGFAESDGESDAGSETLFWVPSRHTPTPSTELRTIPQTPAPRLATSVSSLDSIVPERPVALQPLRPGPRFSRPRKIRSEAPELPDSTDFVCGTLDEDRPLEAAYLSCMEERRKMKHVTIPQDIDPSFPTSDPEDKDEDDEDNDDSDEHFLVNGEMDDDVVKRHDHLPARGRKSSLSKRSPAPSPRPARLHRSPAPKHHSSPPKRMRSPPPTKRLKSPPRPKRLSIAVPLDLQTHGINYAPLDKRPGLTHTASLPRSPAPFVRSCNAKSALSQVLGTSDDSSSVSAHRRGAIDIVKGLQNKQQRRREKLAQKCQFRAAKEKPKQSRRPQPGKGAERMKEVGEQKAGRTAKVHTAAAAQPKYVLSI